MSAPPDTLTQRVLAYTQLMQALVPMITGPDDWAPLAEFVSTDEFERVGTFLEVHDWTAYTQMLTQWASAVDRFETTVRRITESDRLVYFEVEERHYRGDAINVVNSMTVFDFDDDKIRHLDVYLQQAR